MKDNSNYIEHIANTSYKNAVKNVSSTDINKAWYEEETTVLPRVDAAAVLLDYAYIPKTPEECLFVNNTHYVTLKESDIPLVERFEDVELEQVRGTTFKSEKLIDVLQNEAYHLTIKDANDEEVPFGLSKWTTDAGLGYLAFVEGLPDYVLPFRISGYRYIGRKIADHLITTDGKTQMLPAYIPTESQDVATKKYVDASVKKVDDYAQLMKPPKPATFEGKELTLICDDAFASVDLVDGTEYAHTVLQDWTFTIDIPEFYNPGVGKVDLMLFNKGVWWPMVTANLMENDIQDVGFIVTFRGDAYRDTLASRGFYNSIKMHFTTSFQKIAQLMTSLNAPLLFKMRFTDASSMIESKELLIGTEPPQRKDVLTNDYLRLTPTVDYQTKWVSGVPTPTANSELIIDKVAFTTLQNVTKKTETHTFECFGIEHSRFPALTYPAYLPTTEVYEKVIVPSNYYNEKFPVAIKTFDVFRKQNGESKENFNFRIDTVSDESTRVNSGIEEADSINGFGGVWDSTKDLTFTNELQMLNGRYQWPTINFAINGTGIEIFNHFDPSFIKKGPDYSKCAKAGTRYFTLEFDMKLAVGIFLSFIDTINLKQDEHTKAYNLDSLYIRVEGATDWLDALKPYDGIGVNNAWMQGCLAVQQSQMGTIYCTFGPKPIKGKLYVRVGVSYLSSIEIGKVHIEENL